MTRIRFEEVAIKRIFRWRDPATGKTRQETKRFWQTISRFNLGADGKPKSRYQIEVELEREAGLWLLRKENDMRDAAQRRSAK